MKKVKFIYNPYGGDKAIIQKIDKIIELYQSHNIRLSPFRLNKRVDIASAFEDIDEEYSYILIAGGDGTVGKVVNSMKNNMINLPIAIIPTGTANDFAKFLGMPDSIENSIKQILKGDISEIDLGQVCDKYFINVASAGLFTDVSQKTDTNLKNNIGKLAYYIKGIEQLPSFRKINIVVKSEILDYSGEIYMILIFNGGTAGNLKLAYKSSAQDGLLDVVIIKACPIIDLLGFFVNMMKGEHLEDENSVIYFKAKNIEICSDEELPSDIDGEEGPPLPLIIKCIPNGLKIVGCNL